MSLPKSDQEIRSELYAHFKSMNVPKGMVTYVIKQLRADDSIEDYRLFAIAGNPDECQVETRWADLISEAEDHAKAYLWQSYQGALVEVQDAEIVSTQKNDLHQILESVDSIGAKIQPNLSVQMKRQEHLDKQRIAQFLEQFKADFWDGEWPSDNQYQNFIESPAVCLFSRQDFDSWNLSLRTHIAEVRPYEWDDIEVDQRGIEVLGEPLTHNDQEYWTTFRMRLSVWKHRSQSPLPTDSHGFPLASLGEVIAWVDASKALGSLQQVEITRDLREAVCMELTPSMENFCGYFLYDPHYWNVMAPGDGAWIKPQMEINATKARQEWRVEWAYPGTVLFEFAMAARALAYETQWPEEVATRAMATGELPFRHAVMVSPRYILREQSRHLDRVDLSIDPAVSPLAVQEIYKTILRTLGIRGQVHGELNTRVLAHVEAEMYERGLKGIPTKVLLHEFYNTFQWPTDRNYKRKEKGVFMQAYKRALIEKRLVP